MINGLFNEHQLNLLLFENYLHWKNIPTAIA